MDRWIVLHDGKDWKVVADLNGLFSGDWVGVQRRELTERTGAGAPEIRLETLVHRNIPMDCLHATEEIRSTILCSENAERFCCLRFDTLRQVEIEMAGSVHPRASIYNIGEAERCRATLRKYGLSVPGQERKVIERTEAPLTFVGKDRLRWGNETDRSSERPLAEILAEGKCAPPAFESVDPGR